MIKITFVHKKKMIKITSMHEQCVKVNRQNNEELYIYIYIYRFYKKELYIPSIFLKVVWRIVEFWLVA